MRRNILIVILAFVLGFLASASADLYVPRECEKNPEQTREVVQVLLSFPVEDRKAEAQKMADDMAAELHELELKIATAEDRKDVPRAWFRRVSELVVKRGILTELEWKEPYQVWTAPQTTEPLPALSPSPAKEPEKYKPKTRPSPIPKKISSSATEDNSGSMVNGVSLTLLGLALLLGARRVLRANQS